MPKTLALEQYQRREGQELSTRQRDYLSLLVPTMTVTPTRGVVGAYDLTPGSQIGTVDLGDLVIIIAPKIEISRLLFMISHGLDRWNWQSAMPELERAPDVFEAVIQVFVKHVQAATRLGLLHGYVQTDDSMPVVRGRIRLGDQVTRWYGRSRPVEVTYDDFTHDIHENMLLRAALEQLHLVRQRSAKTAHLVRSTRGILRDVARYPYDRHALPTVVYTRLNQHYRPAIDLAVLILRSISFEIEHGDVRVGAFLLDMDDVFEDFVYTALREALHVSVTDFPRRARGKGMFLDEEGRVHLEPDLSLWKGSRCRFVGDVKYKSLTGKGPPNADLYQLLAYATAADLDEALVVYAATAENELVDHYRVRHADRELRVVSLELTRPPVQILQQIEAIAEWIQGRRSEGLGEPQVS